MSKDKVITVKTENDTKELAQKIAKNITGGEVIALIGDLGAGKTYFTKYFAETLGVAPSEIISPTFVYWRKHQGKKFLLNHFDFYRIEDISEVDTFGLEEAFDDKASVTVIEWADKVIDVLPDERLEINITKADGERIFRITSKGETHEHLIKNL